MKKIIYSLIILMTVLVSCNEYLEEDPLIVSPNNFPTTEGDIQSLFGPSLNHLHNSGGYFERALMFLNEVGADNGGTRRNLGDNGRGDMNFYTISTTNGEVTRAWRELYQGVNEMNFIVVSLENSEEDWAPTYLGAAKAWRAYLYSDLVQHFGEVPLLIDPIDNVAEASGTLRAPVLDVYEQIVQDLQDAEVLLEGHEWSFPGWLPDESFAKAALARAYMVMSGNAVNVDRWAQAAAKAKEVKALGKYSLVPRYRDLWQIENKNNNEILIAGQRSLDGGDTRSLINNRTRPRVSGVDYAGSGDFNANIEFYNKFTLGDIRREVSVAIEFIDSLVDPVRIVPFTEFRDGNRGRHPHYRKYWDSDRPPESFGDQSNRNSNAIPVMRYAEVLLMIAEADNEANGPTQDAYDAINEVRDRAGLSPLSGLTKEQFRDAVRLERELELCMEGKRRFDLIRWGTFLEVMAQDQFAKDNIQPFHILFPIPDDERRLNPAITQNPGYADGSGN